VCECVPDRCISSAFHRKSYGFVWIERIVCGWVLSHISWFHMKRTSKYVQRIECIDLSERIVCGWVLSHISWFHTTHTHAVYVCHMNFIWHTHTQCVCEKKPLIRDICHTSHDFIWHTLQNTSICITNRDPISYEMHFNDFIWNALELCHISHNFIWNALQNTSICITNRDPNRSIHSMPVSTGNTAPPKSIKLRIIISSVQIQIGARRRGAPRRSCRAASG